MRNILTFGLLLCTSLAVAQDHLVFVEAESFTERGGWVVDQQFMDIMGSPILMAHGMGQPVADASTAVTFPRPGEYRVFVRTRNWAAPWTTSEATTRYAPGQFQLSVNGTKLDTVFGTVSNPWHWQPGGTVRVGSVEPAAPARGRGAAPRLGARTAGRAVATGGATTVQLALHDLTGFNGRVDAILFTSDSNFTPPEDLAEIAKIRRSALGLTADPLDAPLAAEGPFDFVVVGGGIAGITSAVSAARLGCKVAFIHDRPILGGNNSSEVRVHLQGRIGYPPFPNLGNLVHELDPQREGNAHPADNYNDALKHSVVENEPNITLYLNTRMVAVETVKNEDGSITIKSVVGRNIESGKETKFVGNMFADCTGDANLGYLAGAEYRMGQESREETGEPTAPAEANKITMGSSVQWYTEPATDAEGNPVKTEFSEVPWAFQFTPETIRPSLAGEWDWETGMNFNQISEFERIRDNGLRAIFGHWSYMKNQSPPEWRERADTRRLGWVAYIAGKRESRRLMGDIMLKEQDIVQQEIFPDASVVTSWTIDLHVPEPNNARNFPGEEFRAVAIHQRIHPYAIPYRCFYSRNVSNLFMAGRNISVSRVALGTIRVMRTTGMMGEVVGMAASLCREHNTTPRGVFENHLDALQTLMERGVGPKPDKYWHSAEPRYYEDTSVIRPAVAPVWLPQAGRNFALDAKVAVSSTREGAGFDAKFINDGKFNVGDNAGRWVSVTPTGDQKVEHWVELSFDEPVSINAVRILSGQAGPRTPIQAFVLQHKDGDRWVDIAETKTEGNTAADIGRHFSETVTSNAFRLFITATPENLARIWELELYHVE